MILHSMTRSPHILKEEDGDERLTPPSVYDLDPDASDAPWFLPPFVEETGTLAPLPRALHHRLIDPGEWRRAQGALAGQLAQAALRMGILAARLNGAGEGMLQRLALREATDLSWWIGDRITADRLALWISLREGASAEDTMALARGGWAVRRLESCRAPGEPGWRAGLAAFLGRDSDGAVADVGEMMEELVELHPVTQAAALFQIWRMLGKGPVSDIEAAVLAARHGATMLPVHGSSPPFMPIAMGGLAALGAKGEVERRLSGWLAGVDSSLRAALALLDRVERWEMIAGRSLVDLQGRTPAKLVACLMRWPMVTAPLAEAETGASRAAVQRNLDLLLKRGLIREVTGQNRYRLWAARV